MNPPEPLAPNALRLQLVIGGLSKPELLDRLAGAGVEINTMGRELFADARFQTLERHRPVEIVQTTVADLGLSLGGTFAEIVHAAAARGLAPGPLELGPHLRLALLDQPEGALGFEPTRHRAPPGSLTVVSPPIEGDGDELRGFYLRRIEGTLWLRGFTSPGDHVWQPQDVLVFTAAPNATGSPPHSTSEAP